jgi:hypothetical protein
MSEVKRYDCDQDAKNWELGPAFMNECKNGHYIEFEDYAALQAERDTLLKALIEANGRLEAVAIATTPKTEANNWARLGARQSSKVIKKHKINYPKEK